MENSLLVASRWTRLIGEHLGAATGIAPDTSGGALVVKASGLISNPGPLNELFKNEQLWQDTVVPTVLPNSPRGEPRERLFSLAMREGRSDLAGIPENLFLEKAPVGPDPADKAVWMALKGIYRIQRRTGGAKPFLAPVPGIIPANYGDSKYRMFTGLMLYYMLQSDGLTVDVDLAGELFALLAKPTGFLLDQELDELIHNDVEQNGQMFATPEVTPFLTHNSRQLRRLVEGYTEKEPVQLALWDASGLRTYQRDLRTLLQTPIPALEKIKAAMFVTYLHLGLRFYRAAFGLGRQADAFYRWLGTGGDLPDVLQNDDRALAEFPGSLRFRWQTAEKRSISRGDQAALAYQALHQEALGFLPYQLLTLTLASRVIRSLGGPAVTSFVELAAFCQDDTRRRQLDTVCKALRLLYHVTHDRGTQLPALDHGSGLWHLREAVRSHTELARHWQTLLRYILPPGLDGLSSTQGPVSFFQLGPYGLFWLARLVTRGRSVPLNDFLAEISAVYGLAPQDRREQELMVGGLARMNLFARYADAGESHYVAHIL